MSDIERQKLETVQQHPERAATTTVEVDQQIYFQATYADRAVTQACIGCHNAHPRSPKHDFKINAITDVIIEIPLKPKYRRTAASKKRWGRVFAPVRDGKLPRPET